jgi:hypothetical protein
MIEQLLEKIKGFLLHPVGTFQKSRGDEVAPAIGYFIVLLIFNGILSGIIAAAGVMKNPYATMLKLGFGADPFLVFITALVAVVVVWFIMTLIWGLWLHLWVYVVGGRKGVWNTEKAVIYGSTPYLLIGWIPLIGPVIGGLWTIVLEIIGVRELQELSTAKAILALIIPVLVIFIVLILILAWLFVAIVSSGVLPSQFTQY